MKDTEKPCEGDSQDKLEKKMFNLKKYSNTDYKQEGDVHL